jgi:hypothetical protein
MYPWKPVKQGGAALNTCLSPDFDDELAAIAEANYAHCFCSCCSASLFFILFNGVAVSWGCKK